MDRNEESDAPNDIEDEVESIFQQIFVEAEDKKDFINPNAEKDKLNDGGENDFLDDFFEHLFNQNDPSLISDDEEIEKEDLIISTPKKLPNESESFCDAIDCRFHSKENAIEEEEEEETISSEIFAPPKHGKKDEIEASKRYLEINASPLFRWSMDMIPHNVINQTSVQQQHQQQSTSKKRMNQDSDEFRTRRQRFQRQRQQKLAEQRPGSTATTKTKSFEDAQTQLLDISASPICSRSSSLDDGFNDDDDDDDDDEEEEEEEEEEAEEEETNSIFNNVDRTSIPVIVCGGDGYHSSRSNNLKPNNDWIMERMKHLVTAFSERGEFVKQVFDELNAKNAISDDEDDEEDSEAEQKDEANLQQKKDDFSIPFESMFGDEWKSAVDGQITYRAFSWPWLKNMVYEPQSSWYIGWLLLVSMAFLYNSIMIPYRLVFPQQQPYHTSEHRLNSFLIMDILADLIYWLDWFWFKPRLKYIKNGHWIDSIRSTHLHYFRSKNFLIDSIALLPLDWGCLTIGMHQLDTNWMLLLRLNRLLKIKEFWEFFERIDMATNNPYLFRIIHTLLYELYIIHLGACLYYYVSKSIGFGRTPWTFNNQGNAYLRCFYFAFRTTTSIGGRLPKPTTEFERIYMMFAWLLGVFVFAMVIGQIRDIVAHASKNQNYYIDALNKIAAHMNRLNVPRKLQKRVRFWFKFTWDLQKTFNENEIIRLLPLKMRTDLVLSIHSKTLSRVDLFQNINRSVLRDLVLKLKPILFLPGDYVCRKGDVGHEMYIVNKGIIQVLDSSNRKILATLAEGAVFGEIAILNLHGQTKRTADVRSSGYSQLFALKKQDLWETLRHYPEYENVLKRKVHKILKRKKRQAMKQSIKVANIDDQQEEEESETKADLTCTTDQIQVDSIFKERPRTPRLFHTVLDVIEPRSNLRQYFDEQTKRQQQFYLRSNSLRLAPGWSSDESRRNFRKRISLDNGNDPDERFLK